MAIDVNVVELTHPEFALECFATAKRGKAPTARKVRAKRIKRFMVFLKLNNWFKVETSVVQELW
jgi:hypothetical protein